MKKIISLIIIISAVIAGVIVFSFFAKRAEHFDPAITGFGNRYKGFEECFFDGLMVKGPNSKLFASMRKSKAEANKIALWLGASQLHSLSNPHDEDSIALFYANERSKNRGSSLRYFQISHGNATMYELLAAYLAVRDGGIKPDILIFAVTFDDLKENGFRNSLQVRVTDELMRVGGEGIKILEKEVEGLDKIKISNPVERSERSETPQEAVEMKLVTWIEDFWKPYSFRGRLKGEIDLYFREKVAGLIFRVYKREAQLVPVDKIKWSLHALDALIKITKYDGVKLVFYRQPILIGKDFYNDRVAYDEFFKEFVGKLHANGVEYIDFEALVPPQDYGLTNSDLPDHFHFNVNGHRLLGTSMDSFIEQRGY
ncbi:MAG: SGNH/GDSL hydrolase family protein [Nitrospirae bacterium]|nr:SGNH/GDSL hydrolase family protein [Nitrospirota bacterium]